MARTSWGLSLWTTRALGETRQKTDLWHIKKIKWHEHWQGGITGGTMELLPDKRFDYIDMLGSFGITADNARVSAATISEKTHLGIPLPFRVKTAAGITLVDGIITSISFKAKKQRVVVKFKGAVEVLKTFTVMMTSNAAPSARYYIDDDSALAAVHKYALREGLENGLRSNSGRLLEFNITDALFDGIADTEWARTGFTKGEDPLADKRGEMDWDRWSKGIKAIDFDGLTIFDAISILQSFKDPVRPWLIEIIDGPGWTGANNIATFNVWTIPSEATGISVVNVDGRILGADINVDTSQTMTGLSLAVDSSPVAGDKEKYTLTLCPEIQNVFLGVVGGRTKTMKVGGTEQYVSAGDAVTLAKRMVTALQAAGSFEADSYVKLKVGAERQGAAATIFNPFGPAVQFGGIVMPVREVEHEWENDLLVSTLGLSGWYANTGQAIDKFKDAARQAVGESMLASRSGNFERSINSIRPLVIATNSIGAGIKYRAAVVDTDVAVSVVGDGVTPDEIANGFYIIGITPDSIEWALRMPSCRIRVQGKGKSIRFGDQEWVEFSGDAADVPIATVMVNMGTEASPIWQNKTVSLILQLRARTFSDDYRWESFVNLVHYGLKNLPMEGEPIMDIEEMDFIGVL